MLTRSARWICRERAVEQVEQHRGTRQDALLLEQPLAIERIAQHIGPLAGIVAHSVGGAATALAFHLSRGALDVDVPVHGAPMRVLATYFGLRRNERAAQWQALLARRRSHG